MQKSQKQKVKAPEKPFKAYSISREGLGFVVSTYLIKEDKAELLERSVQDVRDVALSHLENMAFGELLNG